MTTKPVTPHNRKIAALLAIPVRDDPDEREILSVAIFCVECREKKTS